MLVEFSIFWTVVLNIAAWLVIQVGLAWLFLQIPFHRFKSSDWRENRYNKTFYVQFLRIKAWKDLLPDGGPLFEGGFAKATLNSKDSDYLRRFIAETRRGEMCHWVAVSCVCVFLLWNPWWGVLINLGYALLANLPCILAQRYNRLRMNAMLARRPSIRKVQNS